MSTLSTLKQQVEEMQAEIERLEAEEREPEIPVGTLCWFWDLQEGRAALDIYQQQTSTTKNHAHESIRNIWKNARIANDIPGVMVFEKHDGGPCPVDGGADVVAVDLELGLVCGKANRRDWKDVTAYAIINKAEWME